MAVTKNIFIDQGSTYSASLTAQDSYGNVINIKVLVVFLKIKLLLMMYKKKCY